MYSGLISSWRLPWNPTVSSRQFANSDKVQGAVDLDTLFSRSANSREADPSRVTNVALDVFLCDASPSIVQLDGGGRSVRQEVSALVETAVQLSGE